MNLKKKVFGTFDFNCVENSEYKEDSVREDIVAPLLKSIGYSPSGPFKMIRSRPLVHPYVMFGTQKRKLSIIPDYILEIEDKPCFVLDAKSPTKEITTGDNVAQVYSYAIHPEVRSWSYGLCNGRQLTLFDITSTEPKHVYDLTSLNDEIILDINQKLNPATIKHNGILDYALDGGIYLHTVMSVPLSMEISFLGVPITHIVQIGDDEYTMSVISNDMAERELMFSFDFDRSTLDDLLEQLPLTISTFISDALAMHPYEFENEQDPIYAHIAFKQTADAKFSRTGEMFFPLRVSKFSAVSK